MESNNKNNSSVSTPHSKDKEDRPGLDEKKFSQAIGIENYTPDDEPIVTPPDDIKEDPQEKKG